MDYIKSYKDLNDSEKEKVHEFIKSKENSIDSSERLDEILNVKIYDYGKGALFYFEDEKVVANICVVLEVAKKLGSTYIHNLKYDKGIENKLNKIEKLIEESKNISKSKGATNIRLGINSQEISDEELSELNLSTQYRSLEMKLKDKNKRFESLDLKELNDENKERYIEIYNNSFSEMPHGTIIDEEYVNERLEKLKNSNFDFYFIVCDEDKEIGFIEVTIENDKGLFDIGLCKEYRGRGYGNRLLETAIQFLVNKEVEDISLIVIEQNNIAYNMYQNRGFEISKVIGHWIVL
ncbi:MAG: GNAT family N-acetyltransferase [Peptostreptococcaceae bacterium]